MPKTRVGHEKVEKGDRERREKEARSSPNQQQPKGILSSCDLATPKNSQENAFNKSYNNTHKSNQSTMTENEYHAQNSLIYTMVMVACASNRNGLVRWKW